MSTDEARRQRAARGSRRIGLIETLLDQLLSGMTRRNWIAVGIVALVLLGVASLWIDYSRP